MQIVSSGSIESRLCARKQFANARKVSIKDRIIYVGENLWVIKFERNTYLHINNIFVNIDAGDGCVLQQDCQGDDLQCVNLECISKDDANRIPLRDIGIQTSLSYLEKKNASTSIDQSHVPVEARTSKILARNCRTILMVITWNVLILKLFRSRRPMYQ